MEFQISKDMLFSDTLVPDIFICDIMPTLPSDCVKVYIYGLFLCKYNKKATMDDFAKKLGLSRDSLNAALVLLENEQLVVRTHTGITFTDVKNKQLGRLYSIKQESTPAEAISNTQYNQRRNQCIQSMNQMFFQGSMPSDWYTYIDNLFNQYHFDEDVMISLFQYCYNKNAMNRKYISRVASSWAKRNITSHIELEKYMEVFQRTREYSYKIAKALRLHRSLTVYEDEFVDTWANEYGFDMDIIEIALKRTTGKSNLNFRYINKILTDWHREGLKTKEEVLAYLSKNEVKPKSEVAATKVPQNTNFKQRKYNKDFYERIKDSTFK
ncbi:MAG: DnaD domain protein [Clostridiaceae bacterium]|jgi:DnaD/phage-associated family protein|nr:DnaD domain protein [Clostridiaceae bacterium]